MKKNVFYLLTVIFVIVSCSNSIDENNTQSNIWSIPINEIRDGGPGKDGIPSIDNPIFVNALDAGAFFLNDSDLVVGIVRGNVAKAYPHEILDWHEIVNDEVDGEPISINYCPLTGTAFGWSSFTNNVQTTFGTSGLLYNANLILYDRNTGSNWSQLLLQSVNGSLLDSQPELVNVVETTWGIWKVLYPDTKLLSLNTGFFRDYDTYPYGTYRVDNDFFIFPITPINSALPNKERIYAIINNEKSKVYRFSNFTNGNVIKENFQNDEFLIVGNENLINSFQLNPDHSNLEFSYIFNNSEAFFNDNEGNTWSIFGKALSGPRAGQQLTASTGVVSYWFAIAAFYPNPEIYSE